MRDILKMLFGGDFQAGVYGNGGKVDTKLSIAEVQKIAKATANALGSEFSVTKGSVDNGTFDLDYKGEKYDGGSYLIMENGDVVNVALRGRPIYYNYKTKKKFEFGGDFQAGVYEKGGRFQTTKTVTEMIKDGYSIHEAFDTYEQAINNLDVKDLESGKVVIVRDKNYYTVAEKRKKYADGGYFDGTIPNASSYMTNYAMGGSLEAHGIKVGDTFIKTMSGAIQKVKDKSGNIVYVNLATGERSSQPLMPFNNGGAVTNERLHVNKGEDYEVRYAKPRPARKGYKGLRNFNEGGLIESKIDKLYRKSNFINDDYNWKLKLLEMLQDKSIEAYNIYQSLNKVQKEEVLQELYEMDNDMGSYGDEDIETSKENLSILLQDAKNGKKYALGGLFGKAKQSLKPAKLPNLEGKQVSLKNGKMVQVFEQNGSQLSVLELGRIGTGERPHLINISEVDMTSFKNGGALIGNQKRIDMNKNGKIDAEDFKLLRSSMNGAWRNERKHVNHNEDYEVRYARKKPARTGYKGKRKFATGGGISNFEIGDNVTIIKAFPNADMTGKKGKVIELTKNNTGVIYILVDGKRIAVLSEYISKEKFATGGGISNFERLSKVVAKNYEGKRVKPKYQKEYGKVYSKAEAKEVGNKVAGKVKMMKNAESGAEVKKGNRGGVMVLAKKIRKEGESWKDALKRAGQQLK